MRNCGGTEGESAVRADVTRMLDGLKSCGAVED